MQHEREESITRVHWRHETRSINRVDCVFQLWRMHIFRNSLVQYCTVQSWLETVVKPIRSVLFVGRLLSHVMWVLINDNGNHGDVDRDVTAKRSPPRSSRTRKHWNYRHERRRRASIDEISSASFTDLTSSWTRSSIDQIFIKERPSTSITRRSNQRTSRDGAPFAVTWCFGVSTSPPPPPARVASPVYERVRGTRVRNSRLTDRSVYLASIMRCTCDIGRASFIDSVIDLISVQSYIYISWSVSATASGVSLPTSYLSICWSAACASLDRRHRASTTSGGHRWSTVPDEERRRNRKQSAVTSHHYSRRPAWLSLLVSSSDEMRIDAQL